VRAEGTARPHQRPNAFPGSHVRKKIQASVHKPPIARAAIANACPWWCVALSWLAASRIVSVAEAAIVVSIFSTRAAAFIGGTRRLLSSRTHFLYHIAVRASFQKPRTTTNLVRRRGPKCNRPSTRQHWTMRLVAGVGRVDDRRRQRVVSWRATKANTGLRFSSTPLSRLEHSDDCDGFLRSRSHRRHRASEGGRARLPANTTIK
jgi:hypothetical protein